MHEERNGRPGRRYDEMTEQNQSPAVPDEELIAALRDAAKIIDSECSPEETDIWAAADRLEAHQRGRREGMEEAAKVADDHDAWADGPEIAAAVRDKIDE